MKAKTESPTPSLFDEINNYWSEIADANSTAEQVNFVKSYVNAKGLVLDLGCGNGRHTVSLSKEGYNIVGLDVSIHLLKIAKAKATSVSASPDLIRADMQFAPFRSATFSSVLSLDSSLGYLPSEKEDLQSFKEVTGILVEKGCFLIDVFNRERMTKRYHKKPGLWLHFGLIARFPVLTRLFRRIEYPTFFLLQKRSVDSERMLSDLWVFHDKKTGEAKVVRHIVRLYGISQLQTLLKNAGLEVSMVYGGYKRQEFSSSSNRLIIIATKL